LLILEGYSEDIINVKNVDSQLAPWFNTKKQTQNISVKFLPSSYPYPPSTLTYSKKKLCTPIRKIFELIVIIILLLLLLLLLLLILQRSFNCTENACLLTLKPISSFLFHLSCVYSCLCMYIVLVLVREWIFKTTFCCDVDCCDGSDEYDSAANCPNTCK